MHITIYSKPNCPQCAATKRAFDRLGAPYTVVDITTDPVALATLQEAGFPSGAGSVRGLGLLDRLPPRQNSRCRTQTADGLLSERRARMSAVVYFSSASRNTERFVEHCDFPSCGVNVFRIPLQPNAAPLNVREPYIIIVPTYGGGDARKAVPPQVKRFLNDPANREWIRGVIASGNTNFGEAYAAAGPIISRKCHVPLMYRFELMGTREDVHAVREGVRRFFSDTPTD